MELTFDRLSKRFGSRVAVGGVCATLTPGVTGLLGANGAGKTTLMRMVCDVIRPTGGRILLDGRDVDELGVEYRALLGYLPQDFGYYPDFSAFDFMRYMATLKGFGNREGRQRSMRLLGEVGLADVARRKIKTFSGGMRQRLGIAQAMLNDPAILVLDEPTAGLDPKERVRFRKLITGFAQDKIVILSTHIVSQVVGKVWECHVAARRVEEMSACLQVANVRYAPDGHAVVRVVADERPMADAVATEPTLEDLYLNVFRDDDRR